MEMPEDRQRRLNQLEHEIVEGCFQVMSSRQAEFADSTESFVVCCSALSRLMASHYIAMRAVARMKGADLPVEGFIQTINKSVRDVIIRIQGNASLRDILSSMDANRKKHRDF